MKKTLIALLILLPATSFASVFTGNIVAMEMGPLYGDIIYVNVEGTPANRPACASNQGGYDYAFDSSTGIGEKMFSVILAAQKSNSHVKISGSNTCTAGAGVEDIRWIQSHQ